MCPLSSATCAAVESSLTIVSGSGASAAAHGHASLLIPGLRAGTYAIDVDGKPKAALIIGGEPGP